MSAVYVDDYILAAVEDRAGTLLQRTGRAALYTIHGLFPPPARSGHIGGKDPISAKSLQPVMPDGPTPKNYSASSSMGRPHRTLLSEKRQVLPTTPPSYLRKIEWHFTNFSPSLENASRYHDRPRRGLFTRSTALRGNPKVISLGAHGKSALRSLICGSWWSNLLTAPPTSMKSSNSAPQPTLGIMRVPSAPAESGSAAQCRSLKQSGDCSGRGISPRPSFESNPTGKLTNSDLEMAAVVLHLSVLENVVPSLRHLHIFVHSDNTPSVAWVTKMATKTAQSDAAHRLVRGLALRQRMLESAPVSISHVAGTDNVLADIASRPIPTIDDDSAFLTHFDSAFPLQNRYWRRASPLPVQLSNVILTLRGQRLTMQRWTLKSGPPTGGGGDNTAPSVELIPGSETLTRPPDSNYCWALPHGLELDILGREGKLPPKLLKSHASRGTSLHAGRYLTPDAL
ncbi:hypothetical protein MHU86_8256 [Fragilaria crotonensis]|nr:hypothetical protein MHU86_8256 [Fragilaria crotonensis]